MKKSWPWAYTTIHGFETCPKQFYHVKVLKQFPFEETDEIRYGNEFHSAAEKYVRDGKPLPGKFSYIKDTLDVLMAKPGTKLAERKMGLTKDLKPCGFFDKDVWFRGVADLTILQEDIRRAFIVDYKTGKSARYADPDQLELMAMCVFKHHPDIDRVNAGLMFVVANVFIKENYTRADDEERLWDKWRKKHARLTEAFEQDVWNPKTSGLCKRHCPVVECWHNGLNG